MTHFDHFASYSHMESLGLCIIDEITSTLQEHIRQVGEDSKQPELKFLSTYEVLHSFPEIVNAVSGSREKMERK